MSQKVVTKYPKRQERGKTSHETYMKRLKEKILEDNQLSTSTALKANGITEDIFIIILGPWRGH